MYKTLCKVVTYSCGRVVHRGGDRIANKRDQIFTHRSDHTQTSQTCKETMTIVHHESYDILNHRRYYPNLLYSILFSLLPIAVDRRNK